jgi:hypothetical protein
MSFDSIPSLLRRCRPGEGILFSARPVYPPVSPGLRGETLSTLCRKKAEGEGVEPTSP